MMQQFCQITADFKKTAVIALYDISFASCYSDEIVPMRDGTVVYRPGPDWVFTPQAMLVLYDLEVAMEINQGKSVGVYGGAMPVLATGRTVPTDP